MKEATSKRESLTLSSTNKIGKNTIQYAKALHIQYMLTLLDDNCFVAKEVSITVLVGININTMMKKP